MITIWLWFEQNLYNPTLFPRNFRVLVFDDGDDGDYLMMYLHY
jgi:hypothetical protein